MTKDKIYHFAVSAALVVLFALLWDVEWSLLIVLVMGVIKELWDKFIEHEIFDGMDVFMGAVGCIFGLWIITMI